MLRKILSITLMAISIIACDEESIPKEPLTHDCSVIVIQDENEEYIWDEAYVFCALKQDPQNEAFHERYPLSPFLLGNFGDQDGLKPRLIKGKDYLKRSKWEIEIKKWAIENCNTKE